ncbi:MAG: serine/threonine-protein kinase [Gemmataceae bacterium]|nr:serine/threonine-protein kinase [Gemmataceae bacterium]
MKPDDANPDPTEQDLAEMLAAFDEAVRGGDPSSLLRGPPPGIPQTALQDWQGAQECVRLLEAVWPRSRPAPGGSALFGATSPAGNDSTAKAPGAAGAASERRIGRFVIRRELGRGGFGTVFLAFDPHLDRDVAVKVPHNAVLGRTDLRARFQREARAAAGLNHPNLVQIYEAGEADAVAYLAMAYCPGITLAQWLQQHPDPVAVPVAADLIATLADAVEHAHREGIIHRDLKPANVLLQNADCRSQIEDPLLPSQSAICHLQSAIPKIADFGLAKDLDDDESHTHTGAVLGTPSYMAPEQTGGTAWRTGPASDIYSLGAILYQLLTARPPFQGDSVLDTLHQVRFQEPVSPRDLRPSVPRDLETICLKCLEKDPARRYASARELCDDLRRFRRAEPIRARPVGALGRTVRWCRRKPMVAGLLAALALVFVGGLAGIVWQWQEATANAERADQLARQRKIERDTAVEERERAERHLRRAGKLVEQLTALGDQLFREQPGLEKTGAALLEKALAYHLDVLPEASHDPRIRAKTAEAWARVAWISQLLGQWDKAVDGRRREEELLEGLTAEFANNTHYRWLLADCRRNFGHVLRDMGKSSEAQAKYRAALDLDERLLSELPPSSGYHTNLANTLNNLVTVLTPEQRGAEAEGHLRRAIAMEQAALAARPNDWRFEFELSLGLEGLAVILWEKGRRDEPETLLRQALAIRQKQHNPKAKDPSAERYLARAYTNLGGVIAHRRPEEAATYVRKGVALLDKLVKEFPTRPYYRRPLVTALVQLNRLTRGPRSDVESESLLRQAVRHSDKLIRDFPRSAGDQIALADARWRLGTLLLLRGRLRSAQAEYAKSWTALGRSAYLAMSR